MNTLAILPNLGMTELLILAFLGLLIFGKKLPEVGKSLGQGIVQFKKGLQGVETQIDVATSSPEPRKKKKKALAPESAEMAAEPGAADPAVADGALHNEPGEPVIEKPV